MEERLPGKFYIQVKDTQDALRDLASFYRRMFPIPVVAVTGSVGKTTTKDMVAAVLGGEVPGAENRRQLQQQHWPASDGAAGSIRSHQVAVLEMGMNHFGEIDYLTRIARPDVAIITNIGDAHIENMGSRENTLKAKCEIFNGMTALGKAVLNGDDPLLRTLEGKLKQEITWCGGGRTAPGGSPTCRSTGRTIWSASSTPPHHQLGPDHSRLGAI